MDWIKWPPSVYGSIVAQHVVLRRMVGSVAIPSCVQMQTLGGEEVVNCDTVAGGNPLIQVIYYRECSGLKLELKINLACSLCGTGNSAVSHQPVE